jgi:hypothetical protein
MEDGTTYRALLALLNRLSAANLAFELCHSRHDAIMVTVVVPGEHWEIEFLDDGEVQVEIFRGDGEILGPEAIEDLFRRHEDVDEGSQPSS